MPSRHYALSLEFAGSDRTYHGRVTLREEPPPPDWELDAENLTIESVEVGGVPVPFSVNSTTHQLRVSGLATNVESVTVVFSGTLGDQPFGLYTSPLGEGEVITTHFEPIGARSMFPCRDRPDAKAVFALEVTAPADLTAISNMPIEHSELIPDGRRRSRFAPTPVMSTYLLYLGVGPFEQVEEETLGHRVIGATARGLSSKTRFALGESARALHFFEEYYGVPYPLPKLHLVAIPKFLSGAMENWGAIASAEPFLLVDEQTSMLFRIGVVSTLTHEIAHQWFGNLVTMQTWDDLWLNESFATFAGYKAVDALHPEWRAWDEFVSFHVGDAMDWDSLPGTHPIHVTVTDVARAADFFDEICYGKGAGVLRMLEGFVGEASFRDGVSLYLREHQGANAEASDLWGAIARTSQQPIGRVMAEWVQRPGFPVVRARQEGSVVHLDQRRFSLTGSTHERPWPIPLTLRMDGQTSQRLMDEATLTLPSPPDGKILIGPGRAGVYRVRYEGELRERLFESYGTLDPVDRWGLLNDARAFLLSGEISLPEYLESLRRAKDETDHLVVTEAYDSLCSLSALARHLPSLQEAFREVFVAQGERLGLRAAAGEAAPVTVLREKVQRARVALDLGFARQLAAQYSDLESVAPELVESVCMAYGATAGPKEYATLRAHARTPPPGATVRQVVGGLGYLPRDDWLVECLELVGTGEIQLSSWVHMLFMAVYFNPDRSGAFWSFLTERLDRSLPMLQTGGWTIAILHQHGIPLAGLQRPEAMRRWVADHPIPEATEGAKKGLDLLTVWTQALERLHTQR